VQDSRKHRAGLSAIAGLLVQPDMRGLGKVRVRKAFEAERKTFANRIHRCGENVLINLPGK